MIILTLRTDAPRAELGLFDGETKLGYEKWPAHRELTRTIHQKLAEILNKSNIQMEEIEAIIVFRGPGSFTGLRIGLSVANALAYAQNIPIVATTGEAWIKNGIKKLKAGQDDRIASPHYDRPVNISRPKK